MLLEYLDIKTNIITNIYVNYISIHRFVIVYKYIKKLRQTYIKLYMNVKLFYNHIYLKQIPRRLVFHSYNIVIFISL